ncbi:unnamed protein product [Sympodiomycopsis kandeliae]
MVRSFPQKDSRSIVRCINTRRRHPNVLCGERRETRRGITLFWRFTATTRLHLANSISIAPSTVTVAGSIDDHSQ